MVQSLQHLSDRL